MGRHSGAIALDVGVAGGAEDILIPETETKIEELCLRMKEDFERGKRSSIIVVAEGDEAGGVFRVAQQVWERLRLEYRVTILGHVQRGGSPTVKDRILASELGAAAVQALLEGKSEFMVGELGGKIALTPLKDTWSKRKELGQELLELVKVLAR
jgi:6-phosphofructokinase 1